MFAMSCWVPEMRRREFVGVCAGAALAAAGPCAAAPPVHTVSEADGVPFSLSVMLWTVFRDLPFSQRLENIDPEENPKYFLTASAEGFEIVRSVGNPHVKFLYDFFHEQIAAGNLVAKLEKNIDLVALVHVADVPGRHHPGTGEINYSNIFRKLADLRYSRYVAMEFNPLGDPVKELREARELAIGSARSARAARSFESRRQYESA